MQTDSQVEPRYDVFVSYRWTEPDQSWVRNHLVPSLKRAGLRVCLDVEDFVPLGDHPKPAIDDQLKTGQR
jgi:hypothetical protein